MVWVRPSRSRAKPSRFDQGRGVEANSGGSGGSSLPADGGEGSGGDGGTRGEGRTQERSASICATAVTNVRLRLAAERVQRSKLPNGGGSGEWRC